MIHKSLCHLFLFFILLHQGFTHRIKNPNQEQEEWQMPHKSTNIIEDEEMIVATSSLSLSLEQWEASKNIANFIGLQRIKSLTIPVSVNLMLIGFNGEGNQGLKISEEQVSEWLGHLQHSMPHTTIPIGDEQLTIVKTVTATTPIRYSTSINVIKLSPMVNTLVENLIYYNMRPDEPEENDSHEKEDSEEKYHLDPNDVATLLTDLIHGLGLTNSYNIFVLNPGTTLQEGEVYGYRAGFSDAEISYLYNRPDIVLPDEIPKVFEKFPEDEIIGQSPWAGYYSDNNTAKIVQKDLVEQSYRWAIDYIAKKPQSNPSEPCSNEDEDSPTCYQRPTEKKTLLQFAKDMAVNGSQRSVHYLSRVHTLGTGRPGLGGVREDCLVDSWIGHSRLAFLDLTAGPFQWGPPVSGEGVRTKTSLPTVPRRGQVDAQKGVGGNLKPVGEGAQSEQRAKDYQNEVDLVEQMYAEECVSHGKEADNEFCRALKKQMTEKSTGKAHSIIEGSLNEGAGASQVEDNFMSRLGNLISMTLKHVILPSSPIFPSVFAEKVSFHIYVISNDLTEKEGMTRFPYEEFRSEISKLKLPTQEFEFHVKQISTENSPAIGLAIKNSMRKILLTKMDKSGTLTPVSTTYLDSHDLRFHLQHLKEIPESQDEITYDSLHLRRTIPIFFFNLNFNEPVLIDKYYASKALSDMILVTRSNFPIWESRLTCNRNPIYWDLANPLRFMLASTACLLGGVIPPHVTYNEATESAIQNWIWSVGDNPLSMTSSGHHFSLIQRDQVFRNYIVHSLNHSINMVNAAVNVYSQIPTTRENQPAIEFLNAKLVQKNYLRIRELWLEIIGHSSELNFPSAMSLIEEMMEKSVRMRKESIAVMDIFELYKCIKEDDNIAFQNVDWLLPIGIVIDLLLVILFFLIRGFFTSKLKIN